MTSTHPLRATRASSAVAHLVLVRPVKALVVISLIISTLLFVFTSCDKRPAAKFHPGDRVRVKVTQEEGTVRLWTRFFREDHYFLTLPGRADVFLPIGEREWNAAWAAKYGPAWGLPARRYRTRKALFMIQSLSAFAKGLTRRWSERLAALAPNLT
jgi:hypothetical protein